MSAKTEDHVANTTVMCVTCGSSHPATIHRSGNRILGTVECPVAKRTVQLSSDADLYLTVRNQTRSEVSEEDLPENIKLLTLLTVTRHCNFDCPVCYAAAGSNRKPEFLPVDEVLRRAQWARDQGINVLTLTGGEAVLHPDLLDLIPRLRRVGLRVNIPTNGLRLSQEPELAGKLKQAGLSKISLQFDTFDEEVHEKLRGNRFIAEKIQAAERVVAAGLQLGIVTTVTRLNLHETGRILEFAVGLERPARTVVYHAATTTGRYTLSDDILVDREKILRSLLESGVLPGATMDHIWAIPFFRPWGMCVHPDCAANFMLTYDRGELGLLNDCIDRARLFKRLQRNTMGQHWIARNLVPLYHILTSAKPSRWPKLARCLAGFLGGKSKSTIVVVGTGGFPSVDFIDEKRIARCATAELPGMELCSPCGTYANPQTRSKLHTAIGEG